MKNCLRAFVLLSLLAGSARADVILATSNPPGTPLTMTAGTTSGQMFVSVFSDNPPNDIMAAWNLDLKILPEASATGTLTFLDPATGTPPDPSNYIFGANGLGIAATNSGSELIANDLFDTGAGPGAVVPGSPGDNLLQMDFLASSSASGLFGIYAVQGAAATSWLDSNSNTQFFTNVPNGTGVDLIGEVSVSPASVAVPLPSTLAMATLSCIVVAVFRLGRRYQIEPKSFARGQNPS